MGGSPAVGRGKDVGPAVLPSGQEDQFLDLRRERHQMRACRLPSSVAALHARCWNRPGASIEIKFIAQRTGRLALAQSRQDQGAIYLAERRMQLAGRTPKSC